MEAWNVLSAVFSISNLQQMVSHHHHHCGLWNQGLSIIVTLDKSSHFLKVQFLIFKVKVSIAAVPVPKGY